MGEHLVCNQGVAGSTPAISTKLLSRDCEAGSAIRDLGTEHKVLSAQAEIQVAEKIEAVSSPKFRIFDSELGVATQATFSFFDNLISEMNARMAFNYQ